MKKLLVLLVLPLILAPGPDIRPGRFVPVECDANPPSSNGVADREQCYHYGDGVMCSWDESTTTWDCESYLEVLSTLAPSGNETITGEWTFEGNIIAKSYWYSGAPDVFSDFRLYTRVDPAIGGDYWVRYDFQTNYGDPDVAILDYQSGCIAGGCSGPFSAPKVTVDGIIWEITDPGVLDLSQTKYMTLGRTTMSSLPGGGTGNDTYFFIDSGADGGLYDVLKVKMLANGVWTWIELETSRPGP